MMATNFNPIFFILMVLVLIPITSLGMIYLLLDYYKRISKTSEKSKIDEVIFEKPDKPTEREILDDWEFENRKRLIRSTLNKISKEKETTIVYFEEISELTNYDEIEVENIVVLLLAEGLLEGDVYFDEEDKGCIKLKNREFKVTYKP
ncbi:MAG: hypothetical protein ACTSX4_13730 [Candidatus Helarchaeota archaeon]